MPKTPVIEGLFTCDKCGQRIPIPVPNNGRYEWCCMQGVCDMAVSLSRGVVPDTMRLDRFEEPSE